MTLPEPYYQDDLVTLYHGDCYEIAPLIEGVDALITDPPYGVGMRCDYKSRKRQSHNDYAPVYGDDRPFDPMPWLGYEVVVLFGANNYAHQLPPTSAWIVWDRLDGVWSTKREQGFSDAADAELAWTNQTGTVRTYRHRWNGFQRGGEPSLHPTQKPVGLMRWLIDKYTKPNDLILDPFMGSGPIARAAKDLGRRYVGIEIEERYIEAAANRCRQEVLL